MAIVIINDGCLYMFQFNLAIDNVVLTFLDIFIRMTEVVVNCLD